VLHIPIPLLLAVFSPPTLGHGIMPINSYYGLIELIEGVGWSPMPRLFGKDTLSDAQTTINSLNAAIDFINDQRSNLGAVQNRLGFANSNLMSSIQNTESSLSTIRDADFAFEASNLARTQILTQSGTAMLAQAKQISQNILSLLK
jgi:flagellin-like hook-associated protein FlgL